MATRGGVGKTWLKESGGSAFFVDEAAVVARWTEDGKRKVKLLGCEGKVFEIDLVASSMKREDEKLKFKSRDGLIFEVDKAVAMQSITLQNFWINCTDSIPVVELNSKILGKVMEYCEKHAHCNAKELGDWDADFVKVNQAMLQDLMEAGYCLNIEGLQLLVCQAIADMLAGKTPEEILEMVNIKKKFTPPEEKISI